MISKNTNNNLQFAILSPNDEAQISKGSEGFGSEWCKMLSNYSYIYLLVTDRSSVLPFCPNRTEQVN